MIQTFDLINPSTSRFDLPYEIFSEKINKRIHDILSILKNETEKRPTIISQDISEEKENNKSSIKSYMLEIEDLKAQLGKKDNYKNTLSSLLR